MTKYFKKDCMNLYDIAVLIRKYTSTEKWVTRFLKLTIVDAVNDLLKKLHFFYQKEHASVPRLTKLTVTLFL